MKEKTNKKYVKIILRVIWYLFIGLFIITVGNILISKANGKVPKFFGYSILNIKTGSMEPTLEVGNYILVKSVNPEDINEGDIITFYSKDPNIYNFPNTHRVVDIKIENGIYEFVTQGDANLTVDKYDVSEDRLIGKYISSIRLLENISNMLEGKGMLMLLLGIQFISCGLIIVTIVIRKNRSNDQ